MQDIKAMLKIPADACATNVENYEYKKIYY